MEHFPFLQRRYHIADGANLEKNAEKIRFFTANYERKASVPFIFFAPPPTAQLVNRGAQVRGEETR